jgi:hypothetical protein
MEIYECNLESKLHFLPFDQIIKCVTRPADDRSCVRGDLNAAKMKVNSIGINSQNRMI